MNFFGGYFELCKRIPISTAISERALLSRMFAPRYANSPVFQYAIVSYENVEKVVKPPQNPVAASNRQRSWAWSADQVKMYPTASDPATFTTKVPTGNPWCLDKSEERWLIRYRRADPNAPPTMTNSIASSIA